MTDDQNVKPDGEGITRRKLVGTGLAAIGATVVWGSPVPFSRKGIGQHIESGYAASGPSGTTGPNHHSEPHDPVPNPHYVAYCSAPGNTRVDPATGQLVPIPVNSFLYLEEDQPKTDSQYTGATPAIYVQGTGLQCPPAPAGFVQQGLYVGDDTPPNLYQYWVKA